MKQGADDGINDIIISAFAIDRRSGQRSGVRIQTFPLFSVVVDDVVHFTSFEQHRLLHPLSSSSSQLDMLELSVFRGNAYIEEVGDTLLSPCSSSPSSFVSSRFLVSEYS